MIVDTFPFLNEFLSLEIRLNTLYDHVDHFVLVEARKTFSGNDKPLFFEENKARFEKFLDKIVHVVVDDFDDCVDAWDREAKQHNAVQQGLDRLNLTDQDIVMISNADEIPNPALFSRFSELNHVNTFLVRHRFFNGYLNIEYDGNWLSCKWPYFFLGTRVAQYSLYKKLYPYRIRMMKDGIVLDGNSWHFHLLDDPWYKLQSYSHFQDHKIKDEAETIEKLKSKLDLFHPENVQFQKVSIDTTFPKFVLDNLEHLQHKCFEPDNLFDVEPKIECFVYTKNTKEKFVRTLRSVINSGYSNIGFHATDASDGLKAWQSPTGDDVEVASLIMSFHPYSISEGGDRLTSYKRIIKQLSEKDNRHDPYGDFILFVMEGYEIGRDIIIKLLSELYQDKNKFITDNVPGIALCRRSLVLNNTLESSLMMQLKEAKVNQPRIIQGYKTTPVAQTVVSKPSVSIIIPCYNGKDMTKSCIDSILGNEHLNQSSIIKEIFVHSNGSSDGTAEMLQEYILRDNRILPVYSESPLGYARAFNYPIQFTHGDYIVSMNNDVTVWDNWLDRLIQPMIADKTVGAVSVLTDRGTNGVEYILGALYAVGRECLMKSGLINESFRYAYFEEYDFSLRIQNSGYKIKACVIPPQTDYPMHHVGSMTLQFVPGINAIYDANKAKSDFMKDNKQQSCYVIVPKTLEFIHKIINSILPDDEALVCIVTEQASLMQSIHNELTVLYGHHVHLLPSLTAGTVDKIKIGRAFFGSTSTSCFIE